MIITLTPNTGIDYTLVVPRFEINTTIRSVEQVWAGKRLMRPGSWENWESRLWRLALLRVLPGSNRDFSYAYIRGIPTPYQ